MAKKAGKKTGKTKLSGLAAAWKGAREETKNDGEFVPVDAGQYLMQLVAAEVGSYKGERKLWVRWCVVDSDDFGGAICNEFMGIETAERLVWVQRCLMNLGVEIDPDEMETEEDLVQLFQDLIDEWTVAKIKVTESEGSNRIFKNLRIQGVAEVDEDLLVDPEEAVSKTKTSSGSATRNAEEPEEEAEAEGEGDEGEWEIGDRVTWKDSRGKARVGEITGWDSDDNAEVKTEDTNKTVSVDPEKLEVAEAKPEPKKPSKKKGKTSKKKKSKSSKAAKEPEEEDEFTVGREVTVEDEGEDWIGKITSVPDGGGDVQVTFDELPDAPEMVARDRITFTDGEGEGEEPAASEEGEGDDEIEVGDRVLVKVGNKDKAGEVVNVDKEDETADIKIDGKGKKKIVTASFKDIDFEVDD